MIHTILLCIACVLAFFAAVPIIPTSVALGWLAVFFFLLHLVIGQFGG